MFTLQLALLALATAAAGAVAWRIPKLGRDRRWATGARELGLVVVGDSRAWGQLDGHEIGLRWTEGGDATLWIGGTGALDRVPDVKAGLRQSVALGYRGLPGTDYRWCTPEEAREVARLGLAALQEVPSTGRLSFSISARAGDEPRLVGLVARLAVWMARELGWAPTWDESRADPRLSADDWAGRLGGAVPTGSLPNRGRRDRARSAMRSRDPWVATLGALHLGADGVPTLRALVLDPNGPDDLVAVAMRGVWDVLSATELTPLLERDQEEVVTRAAWGLARVGTMAELPALRRHQLDAGARGRAVRTAIQQIVARTEAAPGQLSLETQRLAGRLAELRAKAPRGVLHG